LPPLPRATEVFYFDIWVGLFGIGRRTKRRENGFVIPSAARNLDRAQIYKILRCAADELKSIVFYVGSWRGSAGRADYPAGLDFNGFQSAR
jgi:hypothetical protein